MAAEGADRLAKRVARCYAEFVRSARIASANGGLVRQSSFMERVKAMPAQSGQQAIPPVSQQRPHIVLSALLLIATQLSMALPAQAEIRVVTAQGEYRMGDRDTREDAIRMATESAKRTALEQVATYLESITVVDGMDVTKDEIRTYTAGLVLVLDQQTNTTIDGDAIVVKVDLVAQVDTEEVGHAIAALRENEDARVQLAALKQENEQLQQELEAANLALANASTPDQTQQAFQQRQEILNRVQSNAMVSQAWTDWVIVSPAVYPYPWIGLAQTHALLNVARGLYPNSPHVAVAQQVITTRQPPTPPQPPIPPTPGNAPSHMPTHQIVPGPGSPGVPRTLNEITHATPTAPPISNQPGSHNLTDVHQLNPFLAPSANQQLPPHAATRMQQFLRQNGNFSQAPGLNSGSQPPIGRHLPPTINQIHPPTSLQVPRVPYQVAPPRASGGGGGGHHGGGGGGHGARGK
ncbi:hypothetical protein [Nitrospira lenta]|uniref:Uncharacterized protein n=1 Tax=Nitrospira lenta TaxID=1436998 RepID=A0A330L6M9_9BACT|nr:hypothetical protein [Nitrospira lenta]SPP64832.1 conserved hypothetical protein [Nitrospira lenta]